MREASRRYFCQTALLLAAMLPIAAAEGHWVYLAAAGVAAAIGWLRTVRCDRPPLGELGVRVWACAAFAWMLVEAALLGTMHLLALGHFLGLIGIAKLLQRRGLRDDGQLLVVSLLQGIVAAIVSGSAVFAILPVVLLTLGVDAAIRFVADVERARSAPVSHPAEPSWSSLPVTATVSMLLAALAIPAFVLCPRMKAGALGRIENLGTGNVLTGLADDGGLGQGGPLRESRQLVAQVRIRTLPEGYGIPEDRLYFRVRALDRYRRTGRLPGTWRWLDTGDDETQLSRSRIVSLEDVGEEIWPDPSMEGSHRTPLMIQHYTVENDGRGLLPVCCPVLWMGSRDLRAVRVRSQDGMLSAAEPGRAKLRYAVVSPLPRELSERAVQPVDDEPPPLHVPSPPLPQAGEIRDLIRRHAGDPGADDDGPARRRFVAALTAMLGSGDYAYTLSPPPVPPGREPVGDFLLRTRAGHCEYFASALAVMCQMSGIPARRVDGFRGAEYNAFGDLYIVRAAAAHAWVEAFIPGEGWVAFDPTPASPSPLAGESAWWSSLRMGLDYLQCQWSNLVVSYDSGSRRELFDRFGDWLRRPVGNERTLPGVVVAFVKELFGGRLQLSPGDRLLYGVFAVLVVLLTVGVGYVATVLLLRAAAWLRRRLGRAGHGSRVGEVDFYQRYCRRLAALGLQRAAWQTPAEFAAELAARFPCMRPAPMLVAAYYEAVYGGQEPRPAQRLRIEAFLHRLRRLDPAGLAATRPLPVGSPLAAS